MSGLKCFNGLAKRQWRCLGLMWLGLMLMVIGLMGATVAHAADVPAPLKLKIVLAAVAFDRTIDERFGSIVEIGIIGKGTTAADLRAAMSGTTGKKVKGKDIKEVVVTLDSIKRGAVDVVFFTDSLGGDAAKAAKICAAEQVTCVAAEESDVAAGIPVGVALDGDKPKLLINLTAAKACGASFNAQLLKLARIVDAK